MKMLKQSLLYLLILLTAPAFSACGGGGGGGEASHAPVISNLSYSPTSAIVGQGGGTVTVTGYIDFTDPDGDVTTLRLTTSGGADITSPISGISGQTSGTITGIFNVSTTSAGTYTFEIWVIDSKGNSSNKLSGTFTVTPTVTPKVFLDPTAITAKKDSRFTMNVYVENVSNLYSVAFYLIYDPAKIQYVTGSAGDFLKQGGVSVSFLEGTEVPTGDGLVKKNFGITRIDVNKIGASGTGILCTVTFNALAVATTGVDFSRDPADLGFRDPDNNDIQVTIGNGATVNITP